MAGRPGPDKLPFNLYITREEKALINAEAKASKSTRTKVVRDLIGLLRSRRSRRGEGDVKPVPRYNPPRYQKKLKKAA